MQPPAQPSMQQDVNLPNPGYKIPANLWDLDVPRVAHEPGPLASFIRHCATMESPYYPTYSKGGAFQPADQIGNLEYRHAPWRTLGDFRSTARSSILKLLVVVYGQKVSKPRSWDLRHDGRADSNEAYPARLGPAEASARLSISTIDDDSLYPAAASIIKLSFHGSSEAGTYAKECSISVHDGCRSMG